MTAPGDVEARFRALAPAARLVALLCGSIYPIVREATELARVLRVAGIRLDGRVLTIAGVTGAAQEAVESGLVARVRARKDTFAGARQAATWLTREAARRGILEPIRRAHGREAKSSSRGSRQGWERMEVRCNTVSGRFAAVPDRVPDECWSFLAYPDAADLLATLPERHRGPALRTCLSEAISQAAPADPIVAACYAHGADLPSQAVDIAFIRVLQGRLDTALEEFDKLPRERSDHPSVRSGHTAIQALVALLRGDYETARRCLEGHHGARIEEPRGRHEAALSAPLALSLLALLQRDSPADRNLFEAFLQLPRTDTSTSIVMAVEYAATLRAGRSRHPGTFDFATRGFNMLLLGLAGCWTGSEPEPQLPPRSSAAFHGYVERLAAGGVLWALAECLTVIADPRADLHPAGGRLHAAAGKQAARLHARLGTRTLAGVVAPLAPWEAPLRALEHFSFMTQRQAGAVAGPGVAERRRRLTWKLRHRHGGLEVAAYEEQVARNGRWTKGQLRSREWLAERVIGAADLLPQDRAAAVAIDSHARGWQAHTVAHEVLFELAGHPRVVNPAGEAVEVVRGAPELVIERQGGSACLRLLPDDWDGARYHSHLAGDRRCEALNATLQQQRLREMVPRGGLRLPAAAAARLLEAAAGLVSLVRVRGDDVPGAAPAGRPVPDHTQPSVRLEPHAAGLAATLVVEPLPKSELYFAPGSGSELVFGYRDGEALQVRRDLQQERTAATMLAAACPRLAAIDRERWSLQLPGAVQSLELLEQLAAAGARCLWPRGQPSKVVRGEPAQLKLRIKSIDEWLRASGELAIDARRTLNLKQLFTLLDAQPGARFLELTGGEFLALTASFRRQLDDLRALSSPAPHGEIRLHPLSSLALSELVAETQLEADAQWEALQQRLREAQEFDPRVPAAPARRSRTTLLICTRCSAF